MNLQLTHPDTFYWLNKQNQQDRLAASQRPRPLRGRLVASGSLKDRLLLMGGELFIALGTNLKSRASHSVCEPRAA